MGNEGGAGYSLAGSSAANPVQSLSCGVVQRRFAGIEFRNEAHDAVMRGAAAPAADRDRRGVTARPEMSGQRGDKVLAYPDGCIDEMLSVAQLLVGAGRV